MRFLLESVLIISLALINIKNCAAHDAQMEVILKECQTEHGVNELELEQMENYMKDPNFDNQNFKCFTHCVVKKSGFLDEEEKLDADKFLESNVMPKARSDLVSDCKAMHDMTDDPCDYVFALFSCITD